MAERPGRQRVVKVRRVVVTAVVTFALSACAGSSTASHAQHAGGASELLVFAAASLAESFEQIALDFEASQPEVDVVLNIAGSQQLAGQILQGAPADVFASADRTQMQAVVAAEPDIRPQVFAGNALAIAVEPGNPEGITGLRDLTRPGLVVVLPAEEVPAGRYARRALDALGIDVSPSSLETDVRGVLAKVVLGEADAGIVYRTDIAAADSTVEEVAIPPEDNQPVTYPVAVLPSTDSPEVARAFVEHLLSRQAQHVLRSFGFTRP